ncbi:MULTISPECIES: tRNA pseudouridine(38-40) synthase TruA [Bifidobacterium]|uniref:tRNA pseudouridine synthase A n=1 Tax=Bifidobacterium tibiigranuli TaxID=2172043 RepID=A0A5N6S3H3_9BIFI|nr:tRNA pseudouridine(38-40) synthase TruA [Bifidobacterium tibiigranuli]KAE8127546.1 tRNA pseudouridine(38-40) synthase TruA [Bifidobacterium tibiigranuli]KAE8127993.1 tRNA pseudouridine(38-40) synthase TruA [Bifidobacterium tibiigranuli]MCH3975113.1 tRNA pseudouridine(38-40) synthase TruA [Bifidobacterium tibiigranuli]MCH4190309.1 tRNA pseudouridine(38-40) synthase TruA [Bifidobacterium tibiigranuli]MCH4202871.1 tRNA pseudouridine(38-40) synthase TruA [Bifidobacterium tibiigranuli]
MRLRIDLAYDGGDFHGWAKQPGLRTVQGEMETALHRILSVLDDDAGDPLRLVVAGRTDTGVHASHQVCHLDVQAETLAGCIGHMDTPAIEALMRRLRHFLPDDITIHAISEAPEGFDARFSALERTYVFRIADGAYAPDPRLRGFVLSMDGELDTDAMNQASAMMLGLHDFGSFATPNPGGTTIREVKTACWRRVITRPLTDEEARGHYCTPTIESGLVCFTIVADAFAHNMVRSLAGACVQVGLGKRSLDWFAGKMAQPVREGSTGPIAPHGLTLEHIAYPPDEELGARAERIRARRTLP